MGRLFDEEELKKYIIHDGCDKGCGYIDERDLKYVSPVEAITKADYENRLKADMVAILTEIQLEIEELDPFDDEWSDSLDACNDIIQQKINALKAESEDDE